MGLGILILFLELILLGVIAYYYARLLQLRKSLDENALRRQVAREVDALQTAVRELLKEMHLSAQEVTRSLEAKITAAEKALTGLNRTAGPADPPVPEESLAEEPSEELAVQETAPAFPSRYDQVYALANQGYDLAEIARQTRIAQGEIEMVLGLRSKK